MVSIGIVSTALGATLGVATDEGRVHAQELELLPAASLVRLPADHPVAVEPKVELLGVDRTYQLVRFYLANPFPHRDLLILSDYAPIWWLAERGQQPVSSQWSSDPPRWMRLPAGMALLGVQFLGPSSELPIRVGVDVKDPASGDERRLWSEPFAQRVCQVVPPDSERWSGGVTLTDLGTPAGAVDREITLLRLTNGTGGPLTVRPYWLGLPEVVDEDGEIVVIPTCGFGGPPPDVTVPARDGILVRLYRPYYASYALPFTVGVPTSAGVAETIVTSYWSGIRPVDADEPRGEPVFRFERFDPYFGYEDGRFIVRLVNRSDDAVEYRTGLIGPRFYRRIGDQKREPDESEDDGWIAVPARHAMVLRPSSYDERETMQVGVEVRDVRGQRERLWSEPFDPIPSLTDLTPVDRR